MLSGFSLFQSDRGISVREAVDELIKLSAYYANLCAVILSKLLHLVRSKFRNIMQIIDSKTKKQFVALRKNICKNSKKMRLQHFLEFRWRSPFPHPKSNPASSCLGARALPSCHQMKGVMHPGQVANTYAHGHCCGWFKTNMHKKKSILYISTFRFFQNGIARIG